MAISRDLFLAVLSMDAYNRDPEKNLTPRAGITMTGGLGTATVIRSVDIRPEDFQATAWNWNAGGTNKTVIAYRGTDNFWADRYFAYALATGRGFQSSQQADLAQQFYYAITGKSACAHLHACTPTHLHA